MEEADHLLEDRARGRTAQWGCMEYLNRIWNTVKLQGGRTPTIYNVIKPRLTPKNPLK